MNERGRGESSDEERAFRTLARLAELGTGTLPPAQLAACALELTLEAMGADGGELSLQPAAAPEPAAPGAATGVEAARERQVVASRWPEAAAVLAPEREPPPLEGARAADTSAAPPDRVRALGWASCATAPLVIAGRVVGMLECAAARPRAFGPAALELLTAAAALLAPTLERAFGPGAAALPQSTLELRTLQRVSETVARSLDLDVVLDRCLELGMQVAHAPSGAIYLRDRARQRYRRVAVRNLPEEVAPYETAADPIDELLADAPVRLLDLAEVRQPAAIERARALGLSRAILLPLRAEGRTVGMLGLTFDRPVTFPPSTLHTLEAIAGQEAIAIENARAHQLVERRAHLARTLLLFSERALVPHDDELVYGLILETALEITRSDRGLVGRNEGERTWCVAAVGRDSDLVGTSLSIADPYVARALGSLEPLVVEDSSTLDPHAELTHMAKVRDTRSFVLLPLRYRGQPVGMLFAASGEPRRYEAEELEAMQILASSGAEVLERARLQARADAERRRLDATIEHLPFVIAVIDRKGRTLHLNAAGRAFIGELGADTVWPEALARFKSLGLDGNPLPPEELLITKAFRGEHPPPREEMLASPDGSKRITVMAVAAPLPPDHAGQIESVVIGFQDVSALRDLADAKDRFLRVASHELRSPITSLRATTSLLELDPSSVLDPERRAVMLSRIRRQVDRLIKLVEQLLDSARLNSPELPLQRAGCELGELAREGIELATSSAPADRARVHLERAAPVRGVWDPLRIEQVVTNLVSNALRYSAPDSQVQVQVSGTPELARVVVSDRGIGIPKAQHEQLFSPFFRGSNAVSAYRGGLGLGLHITSEIVKRHGGRISVESEVGKGSTFTVELPLGL